MHGVTEWIVSALVPAFVAPNVLKWHWWRFNGYGFFAGMVAGTTAAAILKVFITIHPVFAFLLILPISFAASIVVCLLTRPESDDVSEELLPQRAAVGFLGAGLLEVPGRGSGVPDEPRFPGATCSTSRSAWSGRPAW